MTTTEAIQEAKKLQAAVYANTESEPIDFRCIQHLIDIAKRFEGAVEVKAVVVNDPDEPHNPWIFDEDCIWRPNLKTHILYAIPKEQQCED